jgi:hypothetical protein
MRFQHGRCDFRLDNVISAWAMRFQQGQCDYCLGDTVQAE